MHAKRSSSPCVCLNLRRASGALTNFYDRKLSPVGITVSQFSILTALQGMSGITVSELASRLGLDRTTLVRNLKPLISRQLIIDLSASSSRNRELILSDAGMVLLKTSFPLWKDAQEVIRNVLGDAVLQDFLNCLFCLEYL